MCCEKKMMIGWRNVRSMKLRVQDQEEDQRRPGERLYERTVKHVKWTKRVPFEEDDKGCPMIRMGVSGWEFLLVLAYPGCPGPKAVKRLCVCVCIHYYGRHEYSTQHCKYAWHLLWYRLGPSRPWLREIGQLAHQLEKGYSYMSFIAKPKTVCAQC